MTTTALAVFVKLYQSTSVKARWQNFFVDKTVDGYVYRNFQSTDVSMNRSVSEGGINVTMAATADNLALLETAIANEWLAELVIYEMNVAGGMPSDLTGATIAARFIGEVMGMQTNLTTLAVEIGTAMDAVSGEIPGRRITTSLVGRLPTL